MAWWNRSYVCCIWYMDSFSQWSHLLLTMSRTVGIIILILESLRNLSGDSQVPLVVKNPSVNAGDSRDSCSIPELGRSPGEGNGYLPQYSCLENSMDRGAWWTTVHGVTKSWIRLSDWYFHFFFFFHPLPNMIFFFPSNCCHWLIGNFMPFFACF